ncbi:Saposin-like type B, region 1 family protein [Musa troglodytarum]|uniref:Saposin-like type B, region 1 family protein n=1 Tax=Musa troglodytarum TaxID=320322 RepID=A0A9E7ELF7_9LILI|nr:Saposin-like type B, region 1 family protein [Musa troglodytarum]
MALREGPFLLLVLVMSWASADARSLENFDILVPITEAGIERLHSQIKVSKVVEGDDQLCKLCENFTAQATQYLGENKTRTEIIETLHQACAELKPFKEQIHPEEFCTKFSLCQERLSVKSDDACSLCRGVIAKLLMKLQDPDTQFEVIKMLLQECNMVEHYVQESSCVIYFDHQLPPPPARVRPEPLRVGHGIRLHHPMISRSDRSIIESGTRGSDQTIEVRSGSEHPDLLRSTRRSPPVLPNRSPRNRSMSSSSSSSSRRASLPRRGGADGASEGVLARVSSSISQSRIVAQGKAAAAETGTVAKKLLRSTGKAAWIAGTTFLVLVVPLIIEMDREQQLNELEMQQSTLLGTPTPPQPYASAAPANETSSSIGDYCTVSLLIISVAFKNVLYVI